ncbi:hypothetical protein KAI52_00575 [Candidatus Parcubacteria bacterium]|nr:hypothetical protein [Candidatus Parcubacteria bacterium]
MEKKGIIVSYLNRDYNEFKNKTTGEMVPSGTTTKIAFVNSETNKLENIKIDPQIYQKEYLSSFTDGEFSAMPVILTYEMEELKSGLLRQAINSIALA